MARRVLKSVLFVFWFVFSNITKLSQYHNISIDFFNTLRNLFLWKTGKFIRWFPEMFQKASTSKETTKQHLELCEL